MKSDTTKSAPRSAAVGSTRAPRRHRSLAAAPRGWHWLGRLPNWLRRTCCCRAASRAGRSRAQLFSAVLPRPKPVHGPWQPDPGLRALMRALSDPDARVRLGALDVLAEFSANNAARLVIGAVHDVAPEVRCAAIRAAARLGVRAAIPALIVATDDPDPAVRDASTEALGAVASPLSDPSDPLVVPGDTAALKDWWRRTRLQELRRAAT